MCERRVSLRLLQSHDVNKAHGRPHDAVQNTGKRLWKPHTGFGAVGQHDGYEGGETCSPRDDLVVPILQGTTSRRGQMKDPDFAEFTFQTDFTERPVVPCVSIGTTGAGAPLHAERNFGGGGGGGNWIAFFRGSSVSDTNYYPIVVAHGTSNNFYVRADGYTWASAGYGQGSDRRLKKEITTTSHGLEDVLALRGVNYYWKDPSREHKLQLGLIAQEVEKIVPEVVSTDDKGMKAISYANLVPVLIEATKQLKAEKDAEIVTLRARADKAEAKSAQLMALLCEKFPDAALCTAMDAGQLPEGWHPPMALSKFDHSLPP